MIPASFQLYVMLRTHATSLKGSEVVIQRLETTQDVLTDILNRFTSVQEAWRSDYLHIEYTPSYHAAQNELFVIPDFEVPSNISDTLNRRQQHHEFSVAAAKEAGHVVKAFLGVYQRPDNTVVYYFQIIDQRNLLDHGSKWYPVVFMNNKYSRLSDEALTFGDHLSIIADTKENRLSFRSFRDASLLLDLSSVFRDATDSDIKTILGCTKVKNTPEEITKILQSCDDTMRKRFAIIQHEGTLDNPDVTAEFIAEKAKEFIGIEIKVLGRGEKKKIVFPQGKEELKQFLRFLCQDFYESLLTGHKCISNSHRRLN